MRRYVVCLTSLFIVTVSASTSGQTTNDSLSATDREVLRVAINYTLEAEASRLARTSVRLLDKTSAVCAGTVADRHCVWRGHLNDLELPQTKTTRDEYGGIDFPALRMAFLARNTRAWTVGPVNTPLTVVAESDVRKVPRDKLPVAYPGVGYFVGTSAPAYSADGQIALVFIEGFCAFDCGWGHSLFLRRNAGSWLVIPIGLVWTA